MIELDAILLCSRAEPTIGTAQLVNLYGAGGNAVPLTGTLPQPLLASLGVFFSADGTDVGKQVDIVLDVIDADGTSLGAFTFRYKVLPSATPSLGVRRQLAYAVELKNWTVKRAGLHRIDVQIDGNIARQLPFYVLQI